MLLCLITDAPRLARLAQDAGIDRIMIDLERKGKAARQAGKNLFQSDHRMESIPRVREALDRAKLVVRINPPDADLPAEVDQVVALGADCVMLPYFHRATQVSELVEAVAGRARIILLVETREAVEDFGHIARVPGVDEIHVGLNDLSLSLGQPLIFQPLEDGTIDILASACRELSIPFGFGGIARLSQPDLPIDPEIVLAEQVRVGAERGWLGRQFRAGFSESGTPAEISREVDAIRKAIARWRHASPEHFARNRERFLASMAEWRRRTGPG